MDFGLSKAPGGRALDLSPRGFLVWGEKELKSKSFRERGQDFARIKVRKELLLDKVAVSLPRWRGGIFPLPLTKGFIRFFVLFLFF